MDYLYRSIIFVDYLCESINVMFKSQFFKNGTFTQKSRKELKEDHTSVNILPTLSNIFERIMLAQLSGFFDNVSSKYRVSEKL